MAADALRLSVGTLTILPTGAVEKITPSIARHAMIMAPVAVLPAALAVAGIGWASSALGLPGAVTAIMMLALLIFGTRALHLDGLADTIDGLGASWDRTRGLEVMRRGDIGPMGVAGLLVVLGFQAVAISELATGWRGVAIIGVAICCSRVAVPLACLRGIPPARSDGLGAAVAATVPRIWGVIVDILCAVALTAVTTLGGPAWWSGPLALVLATLAVLALLRHAVRRFGGITGDVIGAAVELSFTAVLLGLLIG